MLFSYVVCLVEIAEKKREERKRAESKKGGKKRIRHSADDSDPGSESDTDDVDNDLDAATSSLSLYNNGAEQSDDSDNDFGQEVETKVYVHKKTAENKRSKLEF